MGMDEDICINKCQSLKVDETYRRRPRKTWKEVMNVDLKILSLMKITKVCDI